MRIERWVNPTQPQTLQIAVFLFYFNAVLGLLFGQFAGPIGFAFLVGDVGAALGIANEYKWGYLLGVAMSLVPFAFIAILMLGGNHVQLDPLNLMFDVALVALLLHPQSRDYQRIWFK
jgi:purine-cytosine permease-like protein